MFPTVRDTANELNLCSTILDGEIVALDQEGVPVSIAPTVVETPDHSGSLLLGRSALV